MGKIIEIKELTFSYDKEKILNSLNILIAEGTFLSIIGPNGSGKTTLLKNIARNLSPTIGKVLMDNQSLDSIPVKELAQKMAAVHQNPDISHQFRVHDIVMMGRHPYINRFKRETSKDIEIVRQAMINTHVFDLRDRFVNELSGGEKQRVMIAKALAQEPDVLLLDEPTSSLDIHHQMEILELLKLLNKNKGISVITVLHDLNMAARFSKEIMLLYKGDVLTLGRTEKVMTAENLEKAYAVEMVVDRNVYTGSIQVCPVSTFKRKGQNSKMRKRVHVICGGGSGKLLIQKLHQENYLLSIGVVNQGDSDWELAKKLSIEIIEEKPFEGISETVLMSALNKAAEADAVVLTSIPFGRGNVENLTLAEQQAVNNKPILFLDQYPKGVSVDFVGGKGLERLNALLEKGMIRVTNIEELLEKLEVC
ncbi:MAG: ABC transporter ATP-binding protein [Tindallia sp. MSAO_Bac2]|nr:MAG: ABC transporter ATP-binding protein [Tindallia sp. MSAO_Bac2]